MSDTSSLGLGPLANKNSPRAKTMTEEKNNHVCFYIHFFKTCPQKRTKNYYSLASIFIKILSEKIFD